jgi:hypothetical protein
MNEELGHPDLFPPKVRQKLASLAAKLGCTEEEAVSKILHLVLEELDQPGSQELRDFVREARLALEK